MNTDLLRVRLELRGTFWDRRPQYCVRANDQVVAQQTWAGDSGDSEYIEFTLEPQGELGSISVELLNKQPSDTRENLDKTAITHDMLLDIVSIHVDDINLGSLLHTASEYRPQYPQGHVGAPVLTGFVTLGWNGVWSITWRNPFFLWLLERL